MHFRITRLARIRAIRFAGLIFKRTHYFNRKDTKLKNCYQHRDVNAIRTLKMLKISCKQEIFFPFEIYQTNSLTIESKIKFQLTYLRNLFKTC